LKKRLLSGAFLSKYPIRSCQNSLFQKSVSGISVVVNIFQKGKAGKTPPRKRLSGEGLGRRVIYICP
jgi:hypothetical protein